MKILCQYIGIFIVLVFSLATISVWSLVLAQEGDRVLTVAFLDVGQGDAVFIESPSGVQVLVDGGSNAAVLRELSHVMPFYDRSIDVVVATHPDKDHIAGLIDVLKRYDVQLFIEPGVFSDTGVYASLENIVEVTGVEKKLARRGMTIDLGSGAYVSILFPDRDVRNIETNTGSIIMQVLYGETEVMLTGDSPKSIERYLVLQDGNGLASDILKAGHHGSQTSSSREFVDIVNPEYVVFSAGKDNSYGHPHQEVINLFFEHGVSMFNTAEEGTIIFTSDGTTISPQ